LRHFTKIAEGIDVSALLGELRDNPGVWDRHAYRKHGAASPHAAMSDCWLRYRPIMELTSPAAFKAPHIPVWYPEAALLPEAKRIALDLMAMVRGEMLYAVLITKIPPLMGIAPHADEGWHVERTEKLYVSLQSAPGAVFGCDDGAWQESIEPAAGDCWLFDNRKRHYVENRSAIDRITLIVCVQTEMFGRRA